MTAQELTDYENQVRDLWEAGELPYLTHLTSGNEQILVDYFQENYREEDWIFASHRCHMQYMLSGHTDLIDKVKAGKSMFLFGPRFVCSAIVGGTLAMACGKALSIQLRGGSEKVHCFCGDGATDQGSFWEALRFAYHRELPLTFIVEDNGAQCGVSHSERWEGANRADRPNSIASELDYYRPTALYYRYVPTYPHAGTADQNGKPTRPPIKWPR